MCNFYSITTNQAAVIALLSIAMSNNQRGHFPTRERPMPPLNPDVADLAPSDPALTAYDEQRAIIYLRMLDADAEGADWRRVAGIVLHIDPDREPDRARQAFESHLARAKWAARHGYRQLLQPVGLAQIRRGAKKADKAPA